MLFPLLVYLNLLKLQTEEKPFKDYPVCLIL